MVLAGIPGRIFDRLLEFGEGSSDFNAEKCQWRTSIIAFVVLISPGLSAEIPCSLRAFSELGCVRWPTMLGLG